jgi:hypothetical protein
VKCEIAHIVGLFSTQAQRLEEIRLALTATSENKEGANNNCITKIEQSDFQLDDEFAMRGIEDIEHPEEVPSSSFVQDAAHTSAIIFENTGMKRTVRVAILMRTEDSEDVESIELASSITAIPPITAKPPITLVAPVIPARVELVAATRVSKTSSRRKTRRRSSSWSEGEEETVKLSKITAAGTIRSFFTFDERIDRLAEFKSEYGHLNPPRRNSPRYSGLAQWCCQVRVAHREQQSGKPYSQMHLKKEYIDRLDSLGFEWSKTKPFKSWYDDLLAFKSKHGHCDVPSTHTGDYRSLGAWCSSVRTSYRNMREGLKPKKTLLQEQIDQLDRLGFKWYNDKKTFEERVAALLEYKSKFGHCNVPQDPASEYFSLSKWVCRMRTTYRQIQEGRPLHRPLTQDQIAQLDRLGIEWTRKMTFEERFDELVDFKKEHGHATPPQIRPNKYVSLAAWCIEVRAAYKKIQEGKAPRKPLTPDHINQLDRLGFEWVRGVSNTTKGRKKRKK